MSDPAEIEINEAWRKTADKEGIDYNDTILYNQWLLNSYAETIRQQRKEIETLKARINP